MLLNHPGKEGSPIVAKNSNAKDLVEGQAKNMK